MANAETITKEAVMPQKDQGHLYLQTNELRNAIIHYNRSASGALTEVKRYLTGGAGSGVYKPVSGQTSAPNAFEGASSIVISPDRRFLFTTNGGDNTVSSFAVGAEGGLTLLDIKRTGNVVNGLSGTAKSLAYSPKHGLLYVLHAFGPDHLRLMSVDAEGRLSPRPEVYTANTPTKNNRIPTMVVITPDGKFVLVGTTFDEPAAANPDGSPILWARQPDGSLKSVASNAPDPDGLLVFAVKEDGSLAAPMLQDGGGGSPFFLNFLRSRPDTFIIGYAVADGISMCTISADGKVNAGPIVPIDTSAGKPSELCWLSVSPDDRFVYATNFGYSNICTYRIDGNVISIVKDPACPRVPGDGTFRGLNGTVSSGPSDSWLNADGSHLYQIYGNAAKLVGYAVQPDGSLTPTTEAAIPYNSVQGLAGF